MTVQKYGIGYDRHTEDSSQLGIFSYYRNEDAVTYPWICRHAHQKRCLMSAQQKKKKIHEKLKDKSCTQFVTRKFD